MHGNRADPFSWGSDTSKLYYHDEASYPYLLFLYSSEMNPEKETETWVMIVAWYGVTPTGSQAGCAIKRAVSEGRNDFQSAGNFILFRSKKSGRFGSWSPN